MKSDVAFKRDCGPTVSASSRSERMAVVHWQAAASQADSAGSIPVTRSLEKSPLTCCLRCIKITLSVRRSAMVLVLGPELFHVCCTPGRWA
jgi:hypothetical protein